MMRQITFRAMGCQVSAALESLTEDGGEELDRLPEWFEHWERRLSRFREESELSALNRSSGKWVQVSQPLWEVFQAAREAYTKSEGLVTPTGLQALENAGYDRSWEMREQASTRPGEALDIPATSLDEVEWDAGPQRIRLPQGTRLDFGGIAKGWAAQQAMLRLQTSGPVLVNAGGDIAISGLQRNGQPWPVGVVDPFRPDFDLELLRLGRSGVATSGTDYRRWRRGDAWQHHIIDPRSGRPAETDLVSVTVVAQTVIEAEMAAKTVLILGSRAGIDWLEQRSGLAGLLIRADGRRIDSACLGPSLWR